MADIDKLIDAVALILESNEPPTDEALAAIIKAQSAVIQLTEKEPYTEVQIEEVAQKLKTRFTLRMEIGALFEAEDYKPWLENRQGDIDWYYWQRYRKHLLTTKKFPPKIVRTLDEITDKVLDRLEDPIKKGHWNRRGLVVGHVQSGKTANYAGLICKAADAGYQVVIVLAGLLNSLRNQTQERLDSDFMGWCTRLDEYIGASRFGKKRRPICFTTSIEDFKKSTASSIAMNLGAVKEPVVFVLKKNKSTLENLHKWLQQSNKHNLCDYSMLLIDDEADHASINTNKQDKDPTAINKAIRDLLSIFSRSSFVGYTATPFANIFIDPENEDEMKNGEVYKDLFPRDFILSLDPPDNYIGPNRLFTSTADLDCIREIEDNEDVLPIKHKIDFEPEILPDSLKCALESFVLAKAIRLLRGQTDRHFSMMVNASRFTRVQQLLRGLIKEKIDEMRQAIGNYASLSPDAALKNREIRQLYNTWHAEYQDAGFNWEEIQQMLKKSIDPVAVITVNSGSSDVLDYSSSNYPNGRTLIAVGGLGLSRGLTLEGLLVSYFLRNSIMYDTLMQMGRWFGYRDGYEDLCRVYMTGEAESWYSHIAEATEELRVDFRSMEKLKLTPLEFGLRVKSHPASLIVTARNKMRTGTKVPHQISLAGRLVETTAIVTEPKAREENEKLVTEIISSLQRENGESYRRTQLGHEWEKVNFDHLISFIERYQSHPQSYATYYSKALVNHLEQIRGDHEDCVVMLKTLTPKNDDGDLPFVENLKGSIQAREKSAIITDSVVSFKKKGRLGEPKDEQAGLSDSVITEIKQQHEGGTINPRLYREVEGRKPLLIIHLFKLPDPHGVGIGYGFSFPGSSAGKRIQTLVEYIVNVTFWRSNFGETTEEEEED